MATLLNETIINAVPVLMPIFDSLHALIQSLQWLVGGMFGLYLILVFLRWRESRMVSSILKEIRDDIRELSRDIRAVNERVNKIEKKSKSR
ncbi:hypothetical protein JXC34_02000 [Candidatus Woesearchaeota archaeon]|nr:hypothetical protein [Candidatus Woesearchaeota archaeon]